ncbi:MAG: penicillin-binding protein 2 [Omnitrophica bacterium]|nr:penicillin-binding protein 2 [Candidatus Omnitrophota bacterium]
MHINFNKTRQLLITSVVFALFATVLTRLFYIQIIRHEFFTGLANKQHKSFVKLPPKRGTIYDSADRIVAIHLDTPSVYAAPREISDPEMVSGILAEELGLDAFSLRKKLAKNSNFTWIKRKADRALGEKIKKLNLRGVYVASEGKRFYPGGELFSHVLGITGMDQTGLEGLEFYYDRQLTGEYGFRRSYRDAKRREIVSSRNDVLPARNGINIVLTADAVIQHIIEKEIGNIAELYRPKAISCIAMDPGTGEILGMANYPSFNPNAFSGINPGFLRNRAVTDSFEPGSVFKMVTASAALEEGVVDFESEFFCEEGAIKIGNRVLHDYRPHGILKFREIIEKSSNIGVYKVAGRLGKEKLSAYIKKFNFGSKTGIDLPGEAPGILRDVSEWTTADMASVPMGHGITVTVLQLVSCVSAIANGGVLMKPYIAKKLLNEEGALIRENKPTPIRRVISKETAAKVKELLEGVVERGTGKPSRIDDFRVCGKTGTAQKVNPKGGYYDDRYISSFVGFAPYDRPRVALAVCVDEPRGKHLASQVCAPAFKNMMEEILSYLEAESDKNEA